MARSASKAPDSALVMVNPDDAVSAESFSAWLDRRQAGQPSDPGLTAAETLAEVRAAGEA